MRFDEASCQKHIGLAPGEYVVLTLSDNGCGMDKDTLSNLYDPFFTTKEMGKGTGLGLAIVYGIVKQNKGLIDVYSKINQGTTFNIFLPRCSEQSELVKKSAIQQPAALGNETILLVEDEPAILEMAKVMLERLGYTVIAVNSPQEAIRIAESHEKQLDMILTDVVMPEMNGRDLVARILQLHPKIKSLFMSGYTANVIAPHGVLDEGVQFIEKPFSRKDLAEKIREVFDQAPITASH
jgi:CheY-like chemotaxis protein